MNENEDTGRNGMRPNEDEASEIANGREYQPKDWHAVEQRAVAEENVQNLRELPMNHQNADEIIREIDPADVLRKVINEA